MQTNHRKIRVPVFVPLSLAIMVLLASSIIGAYWIQWRNHIDRVQTKIEGTHLLYERCLEEDSQMMNGLLGFIKERRDLQGAWLEQNRSKLLEDAKPIFDEIHSKYKITHLYFTRPDKTCFLRVHNPPQYDDLITRATMLKAAAEKKPVWGIELGKYGTFTLRVVHPWFIDGKLTGYIELGEEIEHILPILKDVFDVEFFVIIDKKYLVRSDWEEGMRLMGRNNADWNFLADRVVVDTTFKNLSDKSLHSMKEILGRNDKTLFDTSLEGRNYKGGFIPLIDAGGRVVGNFAIIKDITETQAALRIFLAVLTVIWIAVGTILCMLFYLYIRRVESRLTNVYLDMHDQIEKRKQAEEKLQQAYSEVELEVQKRTAELSTEVGEHKKDEIKLQKLNEDLKHMVDRLTTANRELEQFAFITSHHLLEPVRKISTFGKLLADSLADKLNDDQNENLNFMVDGANKIAQMVKGLKLYMESSVERMEFEDIDLNLLVEQVKNYEAAEEFARTNGTILVPQRLPTVAGCPAQICRVLHQLITNGLKFCKDGVLPEIVVRAYKESENMVRIEVEDNGIGIRQEYLKDLFSPFKRLHTERNYEGIGIGLTISKKIIEKHSGQIGARSVYGRGTVLWFTLPLATAAAANFVQT